MLSVLRQYDLPLHFPKEVLAEAQAIGSTVNPDDAAGRVDCRRHQVVTIDPDDAKDFDDAICLERAAPGQDLLPRVARQVGAELDDRLCLAARHAHGRGT